MNRAIRVVSQVVILLLLASPALAWNRYYGWHRPRVVVAVGVSPWWGPPFAPWGAPPVVAFAPPIAVIPPPVVVQPQLPPPPPVYVERDDAPPPEAQEQTAPGPQEVGAYWYYCPGARAYYPNVGTCSEQWVRVPASAE